MNKLAISFLAFSIVTLGFSVSAFAKDSPSANVAKPAAPTLHTPKIKSELKDLKKEQKEAVKELKEKQKEEIKKDKEQLKLKKEEYKTEDKKIKEENKRKWKDMKNKVMPSEKK